MSKYFCDNLELKKESLKISYVCKKNKKICPHVLYGINGDAHSDIIFQKKGCGLLKEQENKNIQNKIVKDKKDIIEEDIIEKKIENIVKEQEKDIVNKRPQQNRKKNKNYIKQNQEQK